MINIYKTLPHKLNSNLFNLFGVYTFIKINNINIIEKSLIIFYFFLSNFILVYDPIYFFLDNIYNYA